jgi:hypothetical protein
MGRAAWLDTDHRRLAVCEMAIRSLEASVGTDGFESVARMKGG